MLELVKYVVESFAENKSEIEYDLKEKENEIDIIVYLTDADMGKVIGRQGKIVKALRALVRAATPKGSKKYDVEIKEKAAKK